MGIVIRTTVGFGVNSIGAWERMTVRIESLTTVDIDLYIASDSENVTRLRDVLQTFGYDITDASPEDFIKYKILLRQCDLPLDIHPFVAGADSFEAIWSRRVMANIGSIEAPFASLDDLIKMKKAAGHPKDLEDLKELERLKPPGQ